MAPTTHKPDAWSQFCVDMADGKYNEPKPVKTHEIKHLLEKLAWASQRTAILAEKSREAHDYSAAAEFNTATMMLDTVISELTKIKLEQ